MSNSPYGSLEPERWFSEAAVEDAVGSLHAEVAKIRQLADDAGPARPDNSIRLAAGVLAIVLGGLALLVAVLVLFGKRDPNHQLDARSYIMLAAIFILLPGGLFVWAKFFYGKKEERRKQRDDALRQLVRGNPTLTFANGEKITGRSVGAVPWLASEIDKVVECDLHGSYRGHALTLLQCTYVVDMTLSAIEGSLGGLGKLGATIMSHVEHGHIHRCTLEAVVFFEPIPELPDLFWAARKQPLNWYFKRHIGNIHPLDGQPAWLVSSDPRLCLMAISPKVEQLLALKPEAIVQVLGGCLVVIPQTWLANRPVAMPNQLDEIEKNLNWACDLCEALGGKGGLEPRRFSAVPAPAPTHQEAVPAGAAAVSPERAPVAAAPPPPAPARPSKAVRIAAIICGALAAVIGALTLFSMIFLTLKANRSITWPTADGRILEAKVGVKGEPANRWSAQVRYEYEVNGTRHEGNRLSIGSADWGTDRNLVEGQVARYPKGQAIKVYHDPDRHEDAVLEPGLGSSLTCFMVFGVISLLAGAALLYYGIRRPRQALVA